jgi:FecR protein
MTERELLALGQHVRQREDQLLAQWDASEATRGHLAGYVAQRQIQQPRARDGAVWPRWRQRWLGFAVVAAVALAVWFIVGTALWRSPLTFRVGASERVGVLSALELAPPGASLPIRFSDGTVVNLDSEARARVVAVGAAGAEIVIESGRAELDVVPVRGRAAAQRPWRVKSGPFSVEVKGTRFDVTWDPRTDDFALNLFEGSVLVKGCGRDLGETIAAGQGVRASCARGQWAVVALGAVVALEPGAISGRATAAATHTSPELPSIALGRVDAADAGAAHVTSTSSRRRGERPGPSWQELGRAGHFREAFQRASSGGFVAECERSSARDLMLLGDAARLAGDPERARQAYSALRRRFPNEAAAARAAFALGRLTLDAEPRSAARWFDVYLREQPEGPLAQAALERLLELTSMLDDHQWQREVARAYLARYPHAPHAREAAVILERATAAP